MNHPNRRKTDIGSIEHDRRRQDPQVVFNRLRTWTVTVKRATFDRNVKSGKWVTIPGIAQAAGHGAVVQTTRATRGAGRLILVTFSDGVDTARVAKNAANAAARARIIAKGGKI